MKNSSMNAVAFLATGLLLMAGATQASAQTSDAAERCTPDAMRLCNELIPDADLVAGCLKAKRRQLSPECREVISPAAKRRRRAE